MMLRIAATCPVISVGKLPGFRISRAGAALLGMTILAAHLRHVGGWAATRASSGPDARRNRGRDRHSFGDPRTLGFVTAVLSNLVGNVPAVLVPKPFVARLADLERVRRQGIRIGFGRHSAVGAPLTILTVAVGLRRP